MTSPSGVGLQPEVEQSKSRTFPWPMLGWFAALLVVCYFPVLQKLVDQWSTDDDMGHGFFVPLVAGYIVWQKRDELLAMNLQRSWWGVPLIILGGLQVFVGTIGAELFVSRTALLVSLTGILLFFGGFRLLKALAFPLVLMVFMVPLPTIIYNQVTFPLQLLASRMAELLLGLMGFPVLREGNILELASQRLSVVEACSGIRSLLSLTFISLVYAHFFDPKPWMRWALLLSVIPIALLANSLRVTITGVLSEIDPKLAEGIFHSIEGLVLFALELVALVAVHRLLNRIVGGKHA